MSIFISDRWAVTATWVGSKTTSTSRSPGGTNFRKMQICCWTSSSFPLAVQYFSADMTGFAILENLGERFCCILKRIAIGSCGSSRRAGIRPSPETASRSGIFR